MGLIWLLCIALCKITPSHLTSLVGFPTNVFQSLHESSYLKHRTKPMALSLRCQRSGFSQASYIFPCSEIWSGKNSRITFSPFVQCSRTTKEGRHRVPLGLCRVQAHRRHHGSRTGQRVRKRAEFTACAQTACPRKAGTYPGEVFLSGKHHSHELVNNTHEI